MLLEERGGALEGGLIIGGSRKRNYYTESEPTLRLCDKTCHLRYKQTIYVDRFRNNAAKQTNSKVQSRGGGHQRQRGRRGVG